MAFELTVAWLARRADKTTVSLLMRIAWNTVGNIISRVKDYLEPDSTVRFDDLKNIGVDETSYKKGYKYITTVVNLDNSSVIWVGIGHGYNVLKKFFKLLNSAVMVQNGSINAGMNSFLRLPEVWIHFTS